MKRFRIMAPMVALVLVACSDTPAPDTTTSELPSGPVLAPPVVQPPGCSFKDAQTFAKAYFLVSAIRNAALDDLKAAETAAPGSLVRHQRLFAVLKRVADNQAGPAAAGAGLADESIDCSGFLAGTGSPRFVVTDDRGNRVAILTEALTNGAFAFRNDAEAFVETEDHGSAAEPAISWASFIGGAAIVAAANISSVAPPAFQETTISQQFVYRWLLIYSTYLATGPTGSDDALAVEVCATDVFPTGHPASNRIGRISSTGQAVLQQGDVGGFCGPLTAPASTNTIARALQRVLGFFTPTPLQASRVMAPPGVGGSTGGLGSDFGVVDPVSVNPAFQPPYPISNQHVGVPFPVVVKYAGANGTPLENVVATIAIAGNSGVPAGAFLTAHDPAQCGLVWPHPFGLTVSSNEAGIASFCVSTNKPGGYTLSVTGAFTGFADVPIITNLFTVMQ